MIALSSLRTDKRHQAGTPRRGAPFSSLKLELHDTDPGGNGDQNGGGNGVATLPIAKAEQRKAAIAAKFAQLKAGGSAAQPDLVLEPKPRLDSQGDGQLAELEAAPDPPLAGEQPELTEPEPEPDNGLGIGQILFGYHSILNIAEFLSTI